MIIMITYYSRYGYQYYYDEYPKTLDPVIVVLVVILGNIKLTCVGAGSDRWGLPCAA